MRNSPAKNAPEIHAAKVIAKAEALKQIKMLEEFVRMCGEKDCDWGHVGDLRHVTEIIKDHFPQI